MLVVVQGSNSIRLVQSPGFMQGGFTKNLDTKSGRFLQICLYSFIVLAIAGVNVLAATVGIYLSPCVSIPTLREQNESEGYRYEGVEDS
jgi:hypothetical protein